MSPRSTAAPAGARLFSVVTWDNVAQRRYGCVPTCFGLPSTQRRGGAPRTGHADPSRTSSRASRRHERSERPSHGQHRGGRPRLRADPAQLAAAVRPAGRRRTADPGRVHPAAVGATGTSSPRTPNAKLVASFSNARLGQLWQVLTPLTNAAVYYLIFGVILGTKQASRTSSRTSCTGRVHLQLHPDRGAGRHPGDHRQPGADPGAALPPGLPADRRHADPVPAAARLDGGAGRHRAGDRRAAHRRVAAAACRRCCSRRSSTPGWPWRWPGSASKITDLKQVMPFVLRTWMYGSGVLYSVALFERAPARLGGHAGRGEPAAGLHRAGPARAAGGRRRCSTSSLPSSGCWRWAGRS